jgi:hypothetical protein
MKTTIRLVACGIILLAFATQQLPLAQQPTSSPTPQASPAPSPGPGGISAPNADPFPSTYRPLPGRPTLIRNATIMTAAGPTIANGSVLLRDGKIAAVGTNVTAPADALVIDGTGKYVTPGLIDVHHTSATIRRRALTRTVMETKQPIRSRQRLGRAFGLATRSADSVLWLAGFQPRCRFCPVQRT